MDTTDAQNRGRRALLGCLAVVACVAVMLRPIVRFDRYVSARQNVQVSEAQAWWKGRLDLSERNWDSASLAGRVYNVFPPMFTLIAAVCAPLWWGVPQPFLIFGVLLPVIVLAYVLCYRRTCSVAWAAVLAIGLIGGTSATKVLATMTRAPTPYYINHALATLGLLLFLVDYFGKRRVWVACLGLLIAGWSRQLTVLFAIPLLLMALRQSPGPARRRAVATVCLACFVLAALPMSLNALKFGHALDTGYLYIYNDRAPDALSEAARTYGLFDVHFVPDNLYYSCLGFPSVHKIEVAGAVEWHLRPNFYGTGIWWTTPLLLFFFVDARRLWRDAEARGLTIAVAAVFTMLLFYHNTGWSQRGINRFSLDYLPALYALLLPHCVRGRRRWVTIAMIGWSVLYFTALLPVRNVRIW